MNRLLIMLVIAAVFLIGSGCSSTTLVSSRKTEGTPVRQYGTLLIVGMSETSQTRQIFEEIFSDELQKRGIKAISSYTIKSLKGKSSRADFAEAMKNAGADGLLSSRLLDIKVKRIEKTGFVLTDKGVFVDDFYDYYDGYWGGAGTYETFESKPVDEIVSSITSIETSLFDAGTGRMIWTGTSNEAHAEQLISSTQDLANLVLDALAKEGLLSK